MVFNRQDLERCHNFTDHWCTDISGSLYYYLKHGNIINHVLVTEPIIYNIPQQVTVARMSAIFGWKIVATDTFSDLEPFINGQKYCFEHAQAQNMLCAAVYRSFGNCWSSVQHLLACSICFWPIPTVIVACWFCCWQWLVSHVLYVQYKNR